MYNGKNMENGLDFGECAFYEERGIINMYTFMHVIMYDFT